MALITGNTDPNAALALARYLGEEYQAERRESGIWGVTRKPLVVTLPEAEIHKVTRNWPDNAGFNRYPGIPQGKPVPY